MSQRAVDRVNAESTFVKHQPCEHCGSRDNSGLYSDGHSHCFGCGKHTPATTTDIFRRLKEGWQSQIESKVKGTLVLPPDDTAPFIGYRGLQWLNKYGIVESERDQFLWSDERQWLVYPIYSPKELAEHGEKILVAWQARNFSQLRPKPKYITRGPVGDIYLTINPPSNAADTLITIVLVEDIISALRVGRSWRTLPLFGSHISIKLLTMLCSRFKRLVVWLDADKAEEGLKAAHKASQLGFDTVQTMFTDKDPKEYTDKEILNYLDDY